MYLSIYLKMSILGRFKYFAWMSNPMNALVTNKTLLDSKELLTQYREGGEPPGTGEGEVIHDLYQYDK